GLRPVTFASKPNQRLKLAWVAQLKTDLMIARTGSRDQRSVISSPATLNLLSYASSFLHRTTAAICSRMAGRHGVACSVERLAGRAIGPCLRCECSDARSGNACTAIPVVRGISHIGRRCRAAMTYRVCRAHIGVGTVGTAVIGVGIVRSAVAERYRSKHP